MLQRFARGWNGGSRRRDPIRRWRSVGGRDREDDCDKATAEELVCTQLLRKVASTEDAAATIAELRALLDRDDYVGRGVYDDTRFDRHVRAFIRKVTKMAKANDGFGNVAHYQ